jgi:hypothetical protein
MKLYKFKIGKRFKYGGIEWRIIDDFEESFLCISSNVLFNQFFDIMKNNNFAESILRKELNSFFYKHMVKCGAKEKDFLDIIINLKSCDGFTFFGESNDKISLLTRDMYLKYCKILPKMQYKWFLATAENCINSMYVRCVEPKGYTTAVPANQRCGIRPIIKLKKIATVNKIKGGGYG